MSSATSTPEILWAQRSDATDLEKNIVYLTINVPDLEKDYKLEITSDDILKFNGKSTPKAGSTTVYNFESKLFSKLKLTDKIHLTGRNLFVILQKDEPKEEYIPRLFKDKLHNVKTDFERWVDEDEQDEQEPEGDFGGFPGGMDMNALAGGMGGMGGMPGMGGMGGMGGEGFDMSQFANLAGGAKDDELEEDGDDEEDAGETQVEEDAVKTKVEAKEEGGEGKA